MPSLDIHSLSVCMQALEDAVRYYDLLAKADNQDRDDYEECRLMYQQELRRLCQIYREQEQLGVATVPLKRLLKDAEAYFTQ